MSAQTLRDAANVLRERAEAATPGPWSTAEDWAYVASGSDSVIHGYYEGDCPACGDEIKDEASVALGGEDAQWIATMHPGVGLALANMLDEWVDHIESEPADTVCNDAVVSLAYAILGGDA